MSISDKDYADALVYEKQKQAQQQQMEEQMASTVSVGLGNHTITSTNALGAWGSTVAVQQPYGTFKVLTEEDLNNEAMKAPLSALVDMWLARWQGDWVSEALFQEDNFWRITLIRLTGANRLEKHNLATQSAPVYRIIE